MRALRFLILVLAVPLLFGGALRAVEPVVPAATAPAAVAAPSASDPADFDVEAATRAYLSRVSPADKERSDSYFKKGYWLQL